MKTPLMISALIFVSELLPILEKFFLRVIELHLKCLKHT